MIRKRVFTVFTLILFMLVAGLFGIGAWRTTSISAQDQPEWELFAQIPAVPFAYGIDLNADGSVIYVTGRGGDVIAVDSTDLTLITSTKLPVTTLTDSLSNALLLPDQSTLIVMDEHDSVYFLNPLTLATENTISYPGSTAGSFFMEVTSDSQRGFATSTTGGDPGHLRFYDLVSQTQVNDLIMSGPIHLLALTPDETEVYMTSGNEPIRVASVEPPMEIKTIEVGLPLSHITMDSKRNRAYIGSPNNGIVVIDLETASVEAMWPIVPHSSLPTYDENTDMLIVTGSDAVNIVSPETGEVIQSVPIPDNIGVTHVHVSPDGNRIYAVGYGSEMLYVLEKTNDLPDPIQIDIRPYEFPNIVFLHYDRTTKVAILSSPAFDAPAQVDSDSLTFGKTGDEGSLYVRGFHQVPTCRAEDVNEDNLLDLTCHFVTLETGLLLGDEAGILKGQTLDGVYFEGQDVVQILPGER
ncbi:MAG: hypothetical protein GY943_03940 [Chloroflexi bacterium]|nr:hypothetical protein [Chloroflexota bacterium]